MDGDTRNVRQDESNTMSNRIRVISYNIRYDSPSDGADRWSARRPALVGLLKFHRPDIVGLQEATPRQVEDIAADFEPSYGWVGIPRDGKGTGEITPIFYRTDRFELLASSTRWLSDEPNRAGSLGWDADAPRTVVTAVFHERGPQEHIRGAPNDTTDSDGADGPSRESARCSASRTNTASGRETGQRRLTFRVYNTHFDNKGKVAVQRSVELVRRWLDEDMAHNDAPAPYVLMGDLNFTSEEEGYRRLCEHSCDARVAARESVHGPEYTYIGPGFDVGGEPGTRYDYIFVSPEVGVQRYAVLTDSLHGRYPSDHLPVYSELDILTDPVVDYSAGRRSL